VVRRRRRGRRSPRRRLGAALHAGPVATPVAELPSLGSRPAGRVSLVSALLSLGLHGGVLLALLLLAWLAPPEPVEEILPVELMRPGEPAPAPRAIAETRAAFAPAPQAVTPQILNPDVVARATPAVAAQALELDSFSPVAAPTEVVRRVVEAQPVQAVRSVAAPTAPVAVAPAAPALRGPLEVQAPVGPSVGPRAVAASGDSAGLAAPGALGTGSSVREGIASDRDVAGAASGPRLAEVNTRVGESLWGAGPGGEGSGGGVSFEECQARPEVQQYMAMMRERMYARWSVPPGVPADQSVTLQFKLDVAGSATDVKLVRSNHADLGQSAVDALRSASPFPPMSDRVRCLARDRIVGRFSNPTGGAS
jgi:TonB family protein